MVRADDLGEAKVPTWDYEVSGHVRSGVDADTIRRLIDNGTLKRTSRIQQVGSGTWITVDQSEFAQGLNALEMVSGDVVPTVKMDDGVKFYAAFFVIFCFVAVPGIIAALLNMLPGAPPLPAVASEATLEHACSLLFFLVVAVLVGLGNIGGRLRNTAEIIRAAEIVKIRELAEIRRLLTER